MKKLTILIMLLFILPGCSANKPPQLLATIQAAHYLNPNIYNKASPVVVNLYQLKNATGFKQANFFALYPDATASLSTDLLDKQEFEIQPEQRLEFTQNLAPNATAIGILAAYRNPDNASWRQVIDIPPGSRQVFLNVQLETQSINAALK